MSAFATLARRIDAAEASLTAQIGRSRGALVTPLGGGVGVFIGDSPFDKVIGVGFEPLELAALERFEAEVARRGGRVQVEVSTLADPAVVATLTSRGYVACGFEDVLGVALASRPAIRAPHVVELVGDRPDDVEAWLGAVAAASVEADDSAAPEPHESFSRETVERALRDTSTASGYRRFVARIDGEIAGGASLRIHDGIAQLGGAATVARYRRRGVQTSLLAARLAAASQAGCELAVVTTQPGTRSQENVRRAGFARLYARAVLRR